MHPTAAVPGFAHGLFIATVIVWLVAELRQGANRRAEATGRDRGSRMVLRLTYLAGVGAAVAITRTVPAADIRPVDLAVAVGLGVLWCGIGLRLWSFRTLGRYFTFRVETSSDQPVITSGPYRVVRHPSYAGVLLAAVGLTLYYQNWLAVLCTSVVVLGGLVYRIRVEEQALFAELGDPYRDYAADHKRLVPFVW